MIIQIRTSLVARPRILEIADKLFLFRIDTDHPQPLVEKRRSLFCNIVKLCILYFLFFLRQFTTAIGHLLAIALE